MNIRGQRRSFCFLHLFILTLITATALAQPIIIDHSCTDLSKVPDYWIEEAKNLTFHYAHTSHGSQIISGLEALRQENPKYNYAVEYAGGAPTLPNAPGALRILDGNPPYETYITPELYWSAEEGRGRTRTVANSGLFNFSMWSWCGQQSENTTAQVQQYLDTLNSFESLYPAMRFLYMTGHTDGGSATLTTNNEMVRNYGQAQNKILYDFADIESWDPAGNHYPNTDDGCSWCVDWCQAHPADCQVLPDDCAHSHPFNCKLKARAFWWMMARLAGWDGTSGAEPTPAGPTISSGGIVNAASYAPGAIAPGEIVSIFGTGLGPAGGASMQLTSDGLYVTTELAGTRVWFDEFAGPILYTSSSQVNVVVPVGIAGRSEVQVRVEYGSVFSVAVTVNVATAAPGIFTPGATSQGAILHHPSYQVNGPANPAPAGSYIMVYATSGGATNPASVDGQMVQQAQELQLPVTATIGGLPATVDWAGGLPGLVTGVLQVKILIPDDAPVGDAVPLVITVGGVACQQGVTMAVSKPSGPGPGPGPQPSGEVQFQIQNRLFETRTAAPVSWGVPLAPEDGFANTEELRLMRNGAELPAQFTALARWGGAPSDTTKPLAWILVDTQVDLAASEAQTLTLEGGLPSAPSCPLRITRDDQEGVTIETGAATYTLSKTAFQLFDTVTLASGQTFEGGGGIRYRGAAVANSATIEPEHVGPYRISLKVKGNIEGDLGFTARVHFFCNLAEARIDFRLENLTPPATSPDGQPLANDYGSRGGAVFDDLTLAFQGNGQNNYRMPLGELGLDGERSGAFSQEVVLLQESSGDDRWDVFQGTPPRLQSGVTKRASTMRIDGIAEDGPNQIAGWLDANGVTAAVQRAWQNFPKALRAANNRLEMGLFPGEFSRDHELRAGEFKTHTVWVRHHDDASDVGARARSFLSELRLVRPPSDAALSRAAGLFAPRLHGTFPHYENGTDYQITESPEWRGEYEARTVLDAISLGQEYGWVDYGDIPTDFEGITSPFNLKYDAVRGHIYQALRSDDERWWELASAAARHTADIDIQHAKIRGYLTPRRWFEGGIYGHGYHDEEGITNPHRNMMNTSISMSGQMGGLFLWAFVSGDTLVLDSAIEAADNAYWRVTNTDYSEWPGDATTGACAVQAGLQLCTPGECEGWEMADSDYGRTGAHTIKAMLGAYLATGDPAYLGLIENIAAYIDCSDQNAIPISCNRFHFYSMFLRNLGHYALFRQWIGLPEDQKVRRVLANRMDYMTGTLWDASSELFRMCYHEDVVDETLNAIHNNWLFSVADAFAVGGMVLNRPDLLQDYGRKVFEHGAANQFYEGSALSYHSAKEYVNQVGFGHMFLYGYWTEVMGEE